MAADYATYLRDDFELRDDLQDVTLTNAVTSVSVSNVKAKNRSLNYKEVMLGGNLGFETTDQVFMLGCKSLGAAVPCQGDKITTADAIEWTIISQVMNSFGDTSVTYDVVCRKQQ